MKQLLPPSVNWHIWAICNMCCKFCFATFGDVRKTLNGKPSLSRAENLKLTRLLGSNFSKVSLAGGEALLCPYIVEIFTILKQQGITTALITNGAMLIDNPSLLDKLAPHLDWIGISIDSFIPSVQESLGRSRAGNAYTPEQYVQLSKRIKALGIRLKVNTVVNALNVNEDMSHWISKITDERWKLFQVLPVGGQNDCKIDSLLISQDEFSNFSDRHINALGSIVVPENNEAMTGSYGMIDPAGRFFDNATGKHRYSKPILDIGIDRAFQQVTFDHELFNSRGGKYDWQGK